EETPAGTLAVDALQCNLEPCSPTPRSVRRSILWDKLWSRGLSNPLDAIEQFSFLFFLKRLDEREQDAERAARLRGKKHQPIFPDAKLRWSHWTQLPADQALRHVKEQVFLFIKT